MKSCEKQTVVEMRAEMDSTKPKSDMASAKKMRVAIAYHFFANYRVPVLEKLQESPDIDFFFAADSENRLMPGLDTWQPKDKSKFIRARCIPLPFGSMIQLGLIRLAARRDLDCIIYLANWRWPMTWLSAMVARLSGKRVLFWTHGWIRRETGVAGFVRSSFYRLANGLLFYGNRAFNFAKEKKFKESSLYVVFNSLDYATQSSLVRNYSPQNCERVRRDLFGSEEQPIVICCARLHVSKRLTELLQAVKLLKDREVDVNVILIGDGDDKQNLESLAERLGINVHFEGACFDEARIAELTMASNLTVSPGPVGLTVMQSLAYGVPVLTNDDFDTQGPEHEAVVQGRTGDFFKAGDVEDLALKIENWTSSSLLNQKTRIMCMKTIEKFYNPTYQAKVITAALREEVVEVVEVVNLENTLDES